MTHKHLSFPKSNRIIDLIETNYKENTKRDAISYYYNDMLIQLNYEQLYKMINVMSNRYYNLFKNLNLKEYDIVCYLGDGLHVVNKLSLAYTNIIPFFLSSRNPDFVNFELIKKCQAKVLVYSENHSDLALRCQKELDIKTFKKLDENIELLKEFNSQLDFKLIPNLRPKEEYTRPALYMHSSGTTNLPKIIAISNERIKTNLDRMMNQKNCKGVFERCFCVLPVYHSYGFISFMTSLIRGSFFGFAKDFIDLNSIFNDLVHLKITALITTPFLLKRIYDFCESKDKRFFEVLKNLKIIMYSGAPMPENLGNKFINNNINIVSLYGCTETSIIGIGDASKAVKDFKSVHICKGVKLELIPTNKKDKQYEIVIKGNDKGKEKSMNNLPKNKYRVGDVVEISVSNILNINEKVFKVVGRADDTIVHINGEKTNPIPIEDLINENKYVEISCLVGQNNFNSLYNLLLIKLNNFSKNKSINEIIDSLKNTILYSNSVNPNQSKIFFNDLVYIIPYDSEKILPLTPKGTINRHKAGVLFEKEIKVMYENFESYEPYNYIKDEKNETGNDTKKTRRLTLNNGTISKIYKTVKNFNRTSTPIETKNNMNYLNHMKNTTKRGSIIIKNNLSSVFLKFPTIKKK